MATHKKSRCHYEVLELERTATTADIKSQYYKLARVWHPDKNIGNEEEAELKFKEIQQAYEVLSDPQERAWYDTHREQILHGGDGHEEEFCGGINLWPFFSRSCFTGFGDDEEGFFRVFETVFRTLAEEELRFGTGNSDLPVFGNSKSDYNSQVRQFYNFWGGFVSTKNFSWKDMYKATELPNRQIRRLAEKENKKERDKAKRQFNEVVKRLVSFVKRQDPRVAQEQARAIREKEEKEEKEKEEKARRATEREKERAIARELEKERLEQLDFEEMGIEIPSEDKETSNDFYCPACSKVFRSEKQWHNHERSKKHKIAIQQLKQQVSLTPEIETELQQQEEEPEQITSDKSDSNSSDKDEEEDDGLSEMLRTKIGFTKNRSSDDDGFSEVIPKDDELSEENIDEEDEKESEKQIPTDENGSIEEEEGILSKMVQQRQDLRRPKPKNKKHEKVLQEHDEQVKKVLEQFQKVSESLSTTESAQSEESLGVPKTPRKRRRRAEKKPANPVPGTAALNLVCSKCGKTFGTRNNLFNHIKATGHAIVK